MINNNIPHFETEADADAYIAQHGPVAHTLPWTPPTIGE